MYAYVTHCSSYADPIQTNQMLIFETLNTANRPWSMLQVTAMLPW